MNLFPWKKGFLTVLIGACVLWTSPARADLTELQPLALGEWAITNNVGQKYITVNLDGSVMHSPELVNINHTPQQGIYRLDGLPPFTNPSSINVSMLEPLEGGNQPFTMDNFQVSFTPTNANGETTITLGVTAKTSGNTLPYDDALYTGTLQLDINW